VWTCATRPAATGDAGPVLPPLIELGEDAADEGEQLVEGLNVVACPDETCSTRPSSRRCAGSLPGQNWTTKARRAVSCAPSVAHPIVVSRRDGSVIAQSA